MKNIWKVILPLAVIIVALPVLLTLGIIYARRVKPNTVLSLRIEGEIPELASNTIQNMFIPSSPTVTDITQGIDRARTDPHITGLEVRVGETTMSMANIQEIRGRIEAFNHAHKFSVA